jgi:hypothetical protein
VDFGKGGLSLSLCLLSYGFLGVNLTDVLFLSFYSDFISVSFGFWLSLRKKSPFWCGHWGGGGPGLVNLRHLFYEWFPDLVLTQALE